jgi:hypothetical protein
MLGVALAVGCRPQTTALVQVEADSPLFLSHLDARLRIPTAGVDVNQSDGPGRVPGTVVLLLPDQPASVSLDLNATDTSGGAWVGEVLFHSIVRAEVDVVVRLRALGAAAPNGLAPTGAAGSSPAPIISGGTVDAAPPDGGGVGAACVQEMPTTCAHGDSCDSVCRNRRCDWLCNSGSTCNLTVGTGSCIVCVAGATCNVTCTGACSLLCENGASCTLTCGHEPPRAGGGSC